MTQRAHSGSQELAQSRLRAGRTMGAWCQPAVEGIQEQNEAAAAADKGDLKVKEGRAGR